MTERDVATKGNPRATRDGRDNGISSDAQMSTAESILPVAAALFHQYGFHATTTRQIAEALDVQRSSLYHHITAKEEILYRLSLISLKGITEEVSKAIDKCDPEDHEVRLTSAVTAHVRHEFDYLDMHTVMLTEMRALSPEHREEIAKLRTEYAAMFERLILDGQRGRCLRVDISAKLQCLTLLNMMNWSIFWFKPTSHQSVDRLGALFVEIFINGARNSSLSMDENDEFGSDMWL